MTNGAQARNLPFYAGAVRASMRARSSSETGTPHIASMPGNCIGIDDA